MSSIIKLFLTKNPIKRFPMEVQLMLRYAKGPKALRKYFQRRLYYVYACDISHSAKIDASTVFPHPTGIVIGSQAVVEKDCFIYQQVTLGSDFFSDNKMPYVKQNTRIGTGAKLIGNIVIGKNCIIGANAVVTKSVPDDSIVVGSNIIKKRSVI